MSNNINSTIVYLHSKHFFSHYYVLTYWVTKGLIRNSDAWGSLKHVLVHPINTLRIELVLRGFKDWYMQ